MKIRVGVVLRFENVDKLAKLLGINGLEIAEYHPVFEIPWPDGTLSRHDTFESAAKAYEENAKFIARTSSTTTPDKQP